MHIYIYKSELKSSRKPHIHEIYILWRLFFHISFHSTSVNDKSHREWDAIEKYLIDLVNTLDIGGNFFNISFCNIRMWICRLVKY